MLAIKIEIKPKYVYMPDSTRSEKNKTTPISISPINTLKRKKRAPEIKYKNENRRPLFITFFPSYNFCMFLTYFPKNMLLLQVPRHQVLE